MTQQFEPTLWPYPQEEAFLAALDFGLPEWNHETLLLPASPTADRRAARSSVLPHERPISELLPGFEEADVQFREWHPPDIMGNLPAAQYGGSLRRSRSRAYGIIPQRLKNSLLR